MLQFIPATDELIDRPDLPGHWRLVPYQVDHPCFRWSLCEQPLAAAPGPTQAGEKAGIRARKGGR